MSNTTTAIIKEDTAAASPIIEQSEDAKSNQSERINELVADVKNLSQKRRVFRRTYLSYGQIKQNFIKQLLSEKDAADKSDKPKEPTLVQREKVQALHRLLRNFNVALNIQYMNREEDKKVLPDKFRDEIESIFEDKDSLEKLKKALMTNVMEDQQKELPDQFSEKTYKGFVDFLEKYEKVEILEKLEQHLEQINKELDQKKEKLNTLRPSNDKSKFVQGSAKSKKSKNSSKKTYSDHSDDDKSYTVEERFRNLLKEIDSKVQDVKLKKNDYEVYVENQHQIDDFFNEAISEITQIKKNLKQRFEKIQAGTQKSQGSQSRSNSYYRKRNAKKN